MFWQADTLDDALVISFICLFEVIFFPLVWLARFTAPWNSRGGL